jgi:hypothetical protein
MFQGLSRMRTLIDLVRRRTPPQDKEAHEVFALAMAAGDAIEQQEEEINRAWADADQTAWREIAGKQLQALVTMTGVKPDGKGGFISGADGVKPEEAPAALAKLADAFAKALLSIDRDMRKSTKEEPKVEAA